MSDVDYINTFVQKQKQVIDDLMNKGLHLETRVFILEKKSEQSDAVIADLQAKNDTLQEQYNTQRDSWQKSLTTNAQLRQELAALKKSK